MCNTLSLGLELAFPREDFCLFLSVFSVFCFRDSICAENSWRFGGRDSLELGLGVNFDFSFSVVLSNFPLKMRQVRGEAAVKACMYSRERRKQTLRMAFALYKFPFLSLQQAVLNLFPFELHCIQMYLAASALLLACVSWRHSEKFVRSPAMRTVT